MLLKAAPQAAIFDLDGLLLDTERVYTEAAQRVVGRYGKRFGWEVKRRCMARDPMLGAGIVVQELGLPLRPEHYLEARERELRPLLQDVAAMAGAERLVEDLAGAGLPLAVATSSLRRMFDLKTRGKAWFEHFDAIVCGDDGIGRYKPAPDIFLHAARALGIEPSACVAFEDSTAGVEAALAAGMQVIAVPAVQYALDELEHASHVVRSLSDIDLSDLGLSSRKGTNWKQRGPRSKDSAR
ncbi:MAG: HAD-IA family hydrolase [Proteobacteria bacterium]|nr:HAD-IA family hydrolase [Pseudomonadota bacterium]